MTDLLTFIAVLGYMLAGTCWVCYLNERDRRERTEKALESAEYHLRLAGQRMAAVELRVSEMVGERV